VTRIAFRFDASAKAGTGHISRCVTLAKELARRGARIIMTLSTDVQQYCDWLESEGFAVRRVQDSSPFSQKEDAQHFLESTTDDGPFDWIVVDHYELEETWEFAVRGRTRRILVIDDLPARSHDCDLLVDQNLSSEDAYSPYVPPSARVLAGPRYALLRQEFEQLHRNTRRRGERIQTVLVCFGGADSHDHTSAAVEALTPLAKSLQVVVVLGAANANAAAVANACRNLPNHEILITPPNLATLLAQADLAIGGGGTMTWERACVGVPTVAVGIAANQVRVLKRVLEAGYALGIPEMLEPDVAAIRALVLTALRSPAMLAGMARRGLALVDGNGVQRVADAILPREVSFRPATMADSGVILAWRNHPSVRAASLDTDAIRPEVHQQWMEATLRNPDSALLIGERAAEPVGVVRFDFSDDVAKISLYRVPGSAGIRAGLIRNSVEWLRLNRPEISRVVAHVRSDNQASFGAFLSAGFIETTRELVRELRA
jgi:UDP-2,4-diacetamido-2,4,6-trideoxy-beta-L-altropyranose hydrolase